MIPCNRKKTIKKRATTFTQERPLIMRVGDKTRFPLIEFPLQGRGSPAVAGTRITLYLFYIHMRNVGIRSCSNGREAYDSIQ